MKVQINDVKKVTQDIIDVIEKDKRMWIFTIYCANYGIQISLASIIVIIADGRNVHLTIN
jgi:hypothetical protein